MLTLLFSLSCYVCEWVIIDWLPRNRSEDINVCAVVEWQVVTETKFAKLYEKVLNLQYMSIKFYSYLESNMLVTFIESALKSALRNTHNYFRTSCLSLLSVAIISASFAVNCKLVFIVSSASVWIVAVITPVYKQESPWDAALNYWPISWTLFRASLGKALSEILYWRICHHPNKLPNCNMVFFLNVLLVHTNRVYLGLVCLPGFDSFYVRVSTITAIM